MMELEIDYSVDTFPRISCPNCKDDCVWVLGSKCSKVGCPECDLWMNYDLNAKEMYMHSGAIVHNWCNASAKWKREMYRRGEQ